MLRDRDRGDTAGAASSAGASACRDPQPDGSAASPAATQVESELAPLEFQAPSYTTPRGLQEYSSAYSSSYTGAGDTSPSQQTHSRQQSFPILLPLNIRTRLPSPEQKQTRTSTSYNMPLTGDGPRGRASENPKARTGGLPSGMSRSPAARTEGGSPGAQPSPALSRHATPDTTPTRPRKAQTSVGTMESPTPKGSTTPGQSRFAFFTQTLSRLTQSPTSSPTMADDELLNMNVETMLFPGGPPTERDTFSPSAFKNLQANATGLLLKMQAAYRQRTIALRDLEAEREATRDEREEAETRAAHLKMQLEGMARKAADHERDMKQLMEGLVAEKKVRAEEKERMMMMAAAREKGGLAVVAMSSEGSTVSEDLGVDEEQQRRQGWRKSAETMKSDTSYDTDDDSVEVESVFSRSRSPTSTNAPSAYEGSVVDGSTSRPKPIALSPPKPRAAQQMTTFQKLMKNISGEPLREDDEHSGPGCRNCKGQDASAAWDTVSLLRDENKALKQRVGHLEVAVEGALDMVNGIGL